MSVKIHNNSEVLSQKIGDNTSVWQYTVILENAKIGNNCNICSHIFIENAVEIGDNVTIKNGVKIYDGAKIGNNCFIGQNTCFTNDKWPISKNKNANIKKIIIEDNVSIGANVTILPGVVIGKNSIIGAGSVVTKNITSNELWYGNPARKVKNI